MPREGYKCITLKAEVYDHYYANWQAHKKEYEVKGISSFSAYITHILARAVEEKDDC
jgi:hypothetical protein